MIGRTGDGETGRRYEWRRFLLRYFIPAFIALNAVAFMHAWRFTHFTDSSSARTADGGRLSVFEALWVMLTGISNPKPRNTTHPTFPYTTQVLRSPNGTLECWHIPHEGSKGTVILFHGYLGAKSDMIHRAEALTGLGYDALLVDFYGSGGSDGNTTTIGYREADDVWAVFDSIRKSTDRPVILFGSSMGAASILKAIHDHHLKPDAVILEYPFGTMHRTVSNRFGRLGVPAFPLAELLMFWGSVQNGFWTFGYAPEDDARAVQAPVLLMWGEQDDRVTREETDRIFNNLSGRKQLKIFTGAGHEDFSESCPEEWISSVQGFLP